MAAVGTGSEPPSGDLAAPHWSLANAQGLGRNEDILMDEVESKVDPNVGAAEKLTDMMN